jgi:rhamnosyltransferase subunit B
MRFVLTPIGSSGDVHPFVGIGRALRARGHDVVVVTGGPFEDVVRRAGLGFLGMFSTEEYEAATNHPDLWHARRGLRIVMQLVASRLEFAYARLKDVYEPGRTVLVGHSLSFVTRLLEEKEHVPAATLHLAPSVFRSDFEQPAYAPGRTATGAPRWVKRAIWWAVDRLLIDPNISGPLNRFRNELGLPPVRRPFQHWIHSPQRVIGLFPEWFAPPQQDWPASLRLTGFPQYDESDQQGLSPKLQEFLDEGPAPIVFTPGSANQQAAAFFKAAVDASSRLKRRAVLLTRYDAHLPPLPTFVRHEAYAPLSRLLPQCAALVHHAGIGTLAQALAAGIPQLTMPMGFDQPDNTTRLHRLGVATWVQPSQFTGERVAAKLDSLLTDPKVASACKRWSHELKASSALDRTCELLEELG